MRETGEVLGITESRVCQLHSQAASRLRVGLAARLHVARTICRRAERLVSQLTFSETADHVNPHVLVYLNRLSDLLFVLARCANDNGRKDVLWKPGARQAEDGA